ncbi:MAG: STY4528 family pathogenicity island replication protein [Gilliamella apicola]|nr:STY4528 family pathogenicity island replication protein [Gilliamella apicola]
MNQLDTLSKSLIEQREKSSSSDEAIAVLFVGKQFDSFPRELLTDDSITSTDKYAWQRLYIELQQNNHYFPTYDNLQKLWGNQGGLLSRKTVREILSRLVISGWISFKVIRGQNGQVIGNVYILHNTKLLFIDNLRQNDESLIHLLKSLEDKKNVSKSLAILTCNQINAYLESKDQTDDIFMQVSPAEKEFIHSKNIDELLISLLSSLSKDQSSNNELSKDKQISKMEFCEKNLSSHFEMGKNKQSSNNKLPIKSISYEDTSSSTSSSYINSTSTSSSYINSTSTDYSQLNIPSNLEQRLNEKGLKDIIKAFNRAKIDVNSANQVLNSISISIGDGSQINNMTAYIVTNIQKAGRGEYKIWSSSSSSSNQQNTDSVCSNNVQKKLVDKTKISKIFTDIKEVIHMQV